MTSSRTGILRLTTSAALLVLLAVAARAGDEDISPSPYQEFDPVTGYMVTVDPAENQQQGHGPARDDAAAEQTAAEPGSGIGVIHAVVVVAVIIVVAGALRRRRRAQAAAGQ